MHGTRATGNESAIFWHAVLGRYDRNHTLVEVFIDSSSMPDAVALAGWEFMLAFYGTTSTTLSLKQADTTAS